jgi:hypothetical protein
MNGSHFSLPSRAHKLYKDENNYVICLFRYCWRSRLFSINGHQMNMPEQQMTAFTQA